MEQTTVGANHDSPVKTFDDDTVWGEPVTRCRDCAFFAVDERNRSMGFCVGRGMIKRRWPRVEACRRAEQCEIFEAIFD